MKIDHELFDLYARAAKDRHLYFDGFELPYRASLTKFAQQLRNNMTQCEKRVWGFLKTQNLEIRTQHPIDYYIVDFYLHQYRLVIEIDGEQHYTDEGKEYDKYRDEILRLYRLEVLRIPNADIVADMNSVCARIRKYLRTRRRELAMQ